MIVHFLTVGANPQPVGINPALVLAVEGLSRSTRIILGHSVSYDVGEPYRQVLEKLNEPAAGV